MRQAPHSRQGWINRFMRSGRVFLQQSYKRYLSRGIREDSYAAALEAALCLLALEMQEESAA